MLIHQFVSILIDNGWVQERSRPDRQLLDTAAFVGHLVPPAACTLCWLTIVECCFPGGMFADLFGSGRGWPSVQSYESPTEPTEGSAPAPARASV